MLRLLTYLQLLAILILSVSCSQLNHEANKDSSADSDLSKSNYQVASLDKRNTFSLNYRSSGFDTSFLYSAKISNDVGSRVHKSINEIALQKADVPQNDPPFNITYHHNDYFIESSPTILKIVFDNDIFNNTDYYYTNGVKIELVTPLAKRSPLTNLLIGFRDSQINFFGFSIKQNIYTPTNPDIEEISFDDRPFSAFLTLGQFRESYNLHKNISLKSNINFGVIGPASMGGIVQSSIHNIEPVGWDNQIRNNIIIDYSLKLEKGIISTPHLEINVTTGGNVGTVFNKIFGGLYIRTGSFIPVFRGLATNTYSDSRKQTSVNPFQYWFFLNAETNFVLYDATLQGGIFNTENPYTIQSSDINRLVANVSIGLAVYYKKVGFELQNFYLSPEFKNGYDFRWGRIKFIYQF